MTLWTVAHQAPLSMEFSRQEYRSGLPCPPLADRPDTRIKPRSPAFQAPTLQADSLPSGGFPDSSVGKESACNAGGPSPVPGSGRSAGEGIGYPLQHPWASLVAQLGKDLPAMQETWVRSLGWEDLLEMGTATHSSILPGEFRELYSPRGRNELDMTERLSLSLSLPSDLPGETS